MLTLAWLTISLPFLYAAQQTIEQSVASDAGIPSDHQEKESENPLVNTTEEKTNNTNTATEEYLHESHSGEQYLPSLTSEYKVEPMSTYIAFYGELISPPPDAC